MNMTEYTSNWDNNKKLAREKKKNFLLKEMPITYKLKVSRQ